MAMLLRPVRKTAKSFRGNRQVQKIPHSAFISEIMNSTQFAKPPLVIEKVFN